MIDCIRIDQWKGLSGEIPVHPLTLLVGPNGSGKSAIITGLQFCLDGRVGTAKRVTDLIDYCPPGGASVAVTTRDRTYTRGLRYNGGSIRQYCLIDGDSANLKNFEAAVRDEMNVSHFSFSLDDFLSLSGDKRAAALVGLLRADRDFDTEIGDLRSERNELQAQIRSAQSYLSGSIESDQSCFGFAPEKDPDQELSHCQQRMNSLRTERDAWFQLGRIRDLELVLQNEEGRRTEFLATSQGDWTRCWNLLMPVRPPAPSDAWLELEHWIAERARPEADKFVRTKERHERQVAEAQWKLQQARASLPLQPTRSLEDIESAIREQGELANRLVQYKSDLARRQGLAEARSEAAQRITGLQDALTSTEARLAQAVAQREAWLKANIEAITEQVSLLTGKSAYVDIEAGCEVGWVVHGSRVAVQAMSGGEACLFLAALASVIIKQQNSMGLLTLEASELDIPNLSLFCKEATKLGMSNIILATCNDNAANLNIPVVKPGEVLKR